MIGRLDDERRALLEIAIANRMNGAPANITAWIDTAFDGHLVLSLQLIKDLKLEPLADTEAILADGSKVVLETYLCFLNWFGQRQQRRRSGLQRLLVVVTRQHAAAAQHKHRMKAVVVGEQNESCVV